MRSLLNIAEARIAAVFLLCLAMSLTLAACAVGPNFTRPKAPQVERYTRTEPPAAVSADGKAQHFLPGGEVVPDWWRLFNSPQLNAVMSDAVANNLDLQAAQAGLSQSKEFLRAGYGVFYPQLDANFDAARQKSWQLLGGTPTSSIFSLFTLSASVSYALDVFGGERRAVESLGAQVDFQRYALAGTYLSLTGNIANTIIARSAYQEQLRATEQIITSIKDQAGITQAQVQAGTAPYSNLLSLQSQLAAIQATLPVLRQRISQTEHLLATLVGRTPAEWAPPEVNLADIKLPDNLPVTLPSDLVRQRPDILAAEAQLHGASANIGVATAALFPSFTLNGTYGLSSTSMNDLFKSNSSFWAFGGNVAAPLFNGGTYWFRRKAAIEGYNQSLALYRQTVLSAFAQVADTLRGLENDATALNEQLLALNTAKEAVDLIQANYEAGIANYT